MALTSPLGSCTDFSRRAAAPYLAPEVRVCLRESWRRTGKGRAPRQGAGETQEINVKLMEDANQQTGYNL